ncbi:hypothetical protein [Nocardiopsis sp. FR6]|uniref:hypothetical protein n=1 Tax=Nocardiopsis sp. FR6 TaxID=2605986 RepID=UPI00135A5A27|nr:hypothetical protein [Nocardiopsis sp. FR6]
MEDLAEAAKTARRKLNTLRIEAQSFWNEHSGKKLWFCGEDEETDDTLIEENLRRKCEVNAAWSEFNTAEVDCANRISAVYGGQAFATPDSATGSDRELVYGTSSHEGEFPELDLTRGTAFWLANSATAWAGEEFDPADADFGSRVGQAAWDTLAVDLVWGTAAGMVIQQGYWNPHTGWATNPGHRQFNRQLAAYETATEGLAYAGLYGQDGWLFDPRSSEAHGGASWGTWWGNVTEANLLGDLVEGYTGWSEEENDPVYVTSHTTINTALLLLPGGGVLKGGGGLLRLGTGGDGHGGPRLLEDFGSGSDWPDASDNRPGTGSGRPLSEVVEEGTTPTAERFGDVLGGFGSPLLNQKPDGPGTPSPSPTPDPPPAPQPFPTPQGSGQSGGSPSPEPAAPSPSHEPSPQDSGNSRPGDNATNQTSTESGTDVPAPATNPLADDGRTSLKDESADEGTSTSADRTDGSDAGTSEHRDDETPERRPEPAAGGDSAGGGGDDRKPPVAGGDDGGDDELPPRDGEPGSDEQDTHNSSSDEAKDEPSNQPQEAPRNSNSGSGRREWQALPDIEGPARGKVLREPHPRHTIRGVKSGEVKPENSLILPDFIGEVRSDIESISRGDASFDHETQRYEVNGRTYGIEPSGTVFPASGEGILNLNRIEYDALKQMLRAGGNFDRIRVMFEKNPKFKNNPDAVERARKIYEEYG